MLKNNFSNLFKKHGFYILTGVCVAALAAAIGLISVSSKTSDNQNTSDNIATSITAGGSEDVAANDTHIQIPEGTDKKENANDDVNNANNDVNNANDSNDMQTANNTQSTDTNAGTQTADAGSNDAGSDAASANQTDEVSSDTSDDSNGTNDSTNTNDSNSTDNSDAHEDVISTNANNVFTAFDDTQTLPWPVNGAILMDYSMTSTTYFKTLNQYQCNPALLIAADVNSEVHCAYSGTVETISNTADLGLCVTINVGNDYRMIYGQLKDVPVTEGQAVAAGSILGSVAQPTRYYLEEGPHLYFEITRDDIPVDPKLYLETADANS